MILNITRTSVELVGESADEWQKLEEVVRLGHWSAGPRTDEGRLLQLAAELHVPLRVEDMALRRRAPRAGLREGADVRRF